MFQSRHRDAFHFRLRKNSVAWNHVQFQSRHRDAFHFRQYDCIPAQNKKLKRFNLVIERLFILGCNPVHAVAAASLMFQSRHRDAFHFRELHAIHQVNLYHGFNLVIEMLFILGQAKLDQETEEFRVFQSRHRDAFHFRRPARNSQTRGYGFQSRHREAFHFRMAWCETFEKESQWKVSISSSRCFSF